MQTKRKIMDPKADLTANRCCADEGYIDISDILSTRIFILLFFQVKDLWS
jgi:hypothetical protein